jgi:hypothetical protein
MKTPQADISWEWHMGVWLGVAMDSLKFHAGLPCPTLLHPAGRPLLKRSDGCFRGDPPTGQVACGHLLPLWTMDTPRHTPMSATDVSFSFRFSEIYHALVSSTGIRRGVSKRVEDGRRPPALRAGHPQNSHKAVSRVACPQGLEGSSMAG